MRNNGLPELTMRQFEVIRFIVLYRRENPYSPTLREIGLEIGRSRITAWSHVARLRRKGWLEFQWLGKRNCRPTKRAEAYFIDASA